MPPLFGARYNVWVVKYSSFLFCDRVQPQEGEYARRNTSHNCAPVVGTPPQKPFSLSQAASRPPTRSSTLGMFVFSRILSRTTQQKTKKVVFHVPCSLCCARLLPGLNDRRHFSDSCCGSPSLPRSLSVFRLSLPRKHSNDVAQACPYVICLFFIPCHYYTHMVMFMFTAIWATNIHDAVPGNSEPIMGAKYHTVRLYGREERTKRQREGERDYPQTLEFVSRMPTGSVPTGKQAYCVKVQSLRAPGNENAKAHPTTSADTLPSLPRKTLQQVHHTHYHVNFGQFFTFCDQYWGTLKRPQDMRGYQEPSADAAKKAS